MAMGAYGPAAVHDELLQMIAQRKQDEAIKRQIQQQEFENQRTTSRDQEQSRQFNETQQRMIEQAEANREMNLNVNLNTQANQIADDTPPDTSIDPGAAGILRSAGRGSLVRENEPAAFPGFLRSNAQFVPGEQPGAVFTGTAGQIQARDTARAAQEDRSADNARQAAMQAETMRHNRATEANVQPRQSVADELAAYEAKKKIDAQYTGARPSLGAERNTLNYFNRMLEAERNARKVEDQIGNRDTLVGELPGVPGFLENWLKSPAGQQYTQAQRMFTEARLRKESGAAIPENEFANDRRMNFRVSNDDPETMKQKRAARLATMRGIGNASGNALREYYGDDATLDSLLKEFEEAGGSSGTVKMRAPNGQIKDVSADQVEFYKSKGATVVQ